MQIAAAAGVAIVVVVCMLTLWILRTKGVKREIDLENAVQKQPSEPNAHLTGAISIIPLHPQPLSPHCTFSMLLAQEEDQSLCSRSCTSATIEDCAASCYSFPDLLFINHQSSDDRLFPSLKPKIRIKEPKTNSFIDLDLANPFLPNVIIEAMPGTRRRFEFWMATSEGGALLRQSLVLDDLPEAELEARLRDQDPQQRGVCGLPTEGKRLLEVGVAVGPDGAAKRAEEFVCGSGAGGGAYSQQGNVYRRPGTVRSFWEGAMVPKDPFELLQYLSKGGSS